MSAEQHIFGMDGMDPLAAFAAGVVLLVMCYIATSRRAGDDFYRKILVSDEVTGGVGMLAMGSEKNGGSKTRFMVTNQTAGAPVFHCIILMSADVYHHHCSFLFSSSTLDPIIVSWVNANLERPAPESGFLFVFVAYKTKCILVSFLHVPLYFSVTAAVVPGGVFSHTTRAGHCFLAERKPRQFLASPSPVAEFDPIFLYKIMHPTPDREGHHLYVRTTTATTGTNSSVHTIRTGHLTMVDHTGDDNAHNTWAVDSLTVVDATSFPQDNGLAARELAVMLAAGAILFSVA
jgi:hypothetical protein